MYIKRPTIVLLLLATVLVLTQLSAAPPFEGHWEGEIAIPGQPLKFNVDFSTTPHGQPAGEISIPAQGLRDLKLDGVSRQGDRIRFVMPGIPGEPTFEGTLSENGQSIDGTFKQGGASLKFQMTRGDDPADAALQALAGFDEFVSRAIEVYNVPGMAIAVIADGQPIYARGFGYRDLENELPMTADTLFGIGSTTKAMTVTLLGMLVDEGKLEWDAPLREYLPSFRLSDPIVSERITPRDLVTHRSGMPRHDLLWYNNNDSTREEIIARLAYLELTEDLRARFQYNNLMFMTAGYLAGRLAGTTWEEAVATRLFEPLGMERSNFRVADSQRDGDHALPYRENDDQQLERIPFRSIDMVGPAGSVNSSVNEMSRWLLFNLRGGKLADRSLINPSTLAEIHSPQMTTGATPTRPDISSATYGMGWSIDTYRGHRRVSHGGGIDGFVTSVMFFPDDDIGIVSFDNRGSGLAQIVNQHAADRLLGLANVEWLAEALQARTMAQGVAEDADEKIEATRVRGTRPSHSLADYAGDYLHPGYGPLRIEAERGGLVLHYNGIETSLDHWHYDVWVGADSDGDETFEDQKFLFRGNDDGLIAAVQSMLEPTGEPIVFRRTPNRQLFDPAYLSRLAGVYQLETGPRVRFDLAGSTLHFTVPGQPTYTLEPDISGRFVLAEARVVSVHFELDKQGNVKKAVVYQPGAIIDATPVDP